MSQQYIYNTRYQPQHLRLRASTPYDAEMHRIRFELLERFGRGRDVLDLCCGCGSYLLPILPIVRSAYGVDFSATMLDGLRRDVGGTPPPSLTLLEEPATRMSLPDECVDLVFSYTSLYYIPDLDSVLREVRRVLRPGGHAILELGNLHSLNTLVCRSTAREGWAEPHHVSYATMLSMLAAHDLEILERRSFQLLPMYGTTRELRLLYPILHPLWKRLMGIKIAGRMLDEWVSGAIPLRYFAFRHIFVTRVGK